MRNADPLPQTLHVMASQSRHGRPPLNLTDAIGRAAEESREAAGVDDCSDLPSENNPAWLDVSLITDPPLWLALPLAVTLFGLTLLLAGFCWTSGQALAVGVFGLGRDFN